MPRVPNSLTTSGRLVTTVFQGAVLRAAERLISSLVAVFFFTFAAVSDWEITNSGVVGEDNTLNFSLIVLPQTLDTDGLSLSLDFAGQTYASTGIIKPARRRDDAGPAFV